MARPRAGPLGFLEQLSGGLAAPTKQSLQGRVPGGIACPAAATGAAKPGNLFPGFQVSWFPRFPGFLCFLGFQVSYEPKATWKPRNHRKPGNLGNQETWKPGKRFPSSQVSRVPGFLGSQVSRFPRFLN